MLDIRGYHESRTRDWGHALLPKRDRWPGVKVQFRPGSRFELNYDSNPRGYFDDNGGLTYRINEYGFRGPDYPLDKPPGKQRVVLLGDSFTFGEGVRFEDTFGERLEQRLGRDHVEVLNLGVGGIDTIEEVSYLRHQGLRFQPDLVILVYVLNDAGNELNVWQQFRKQYEKRWLKGSYLISFLFARIGRETMGRRYVDALVSASKSRMAGWERSLRGVVEAGELAHAAGSGFAVVIFPFMYRLDSGYPFQVMHRLVATFCRQNGIPVHDLFPAFEGREYTDLWVHPSDQHPNEIGHAIAAESIADFIEQQRLLGPR